MSDSPEREASRQQLLTELARDRWLAHAILFRHRHPDESPDAHRALVGRIYAPNPRAVVEGFRGIGKSTYLEEAALVRAAFREFHNMVVVGASYTRACDRLAAIKREVEINDAIAELFGPLKGPVWQEGKIVLSNGVCIQALGRDQSMLGVKYLDWRPDAALIDDVEDPEETRTDMDREKTWTWFLRTFLPSLSDPMESWVRVLGTRRGKGSLPERLEDAGWPTLKLPIEHADDAGARRATWPAKFPLPKIDLMKADYRGDMNTWVQEYMCQAVSEADRTFPPPRIVPRSRRWEATYGFIDPASTVNRGSATTGWAVWSWIGPRLVVWESGAEKLLPDKIVALAYELLRQYDLTWLGVERDGLNQFLMQPMRQEQIRRGLAAVPLKPVAAISGTKGGGKLSFIRGLQPFFASGEVEFAKPLPDLEKQLLSFPYGPIDAPNALAYAQMMRPGAAVYDGFTAEHICESALIEAGRPVWLAANAVPGLVTAVAVQVGASQTRILGDWAVEGEAAEAVPLLLREAGMALRVTPQVACPPAQWAQFSNIGLVQAFRRVPLEVERGTDPAKGREALRGDFARRARGLPAVQVAVAARRTLNAFAGGYCHMVERGGGLDGEAEAGIYRVLMEGLESCLGHMSVACDLDEGANWAYTNDGKRYRQYGNVHRRAE